MLTINLLGSPEIAWKEARYDIARRQARALLFRLAADRRPVSRETLIYQFWPDLPDAKARKNLSRLASYLRRSLPEIDLLTPGREAIGLDQSRSASDVRHFDHLLEDDTTAALERAVAIYRGSFLSGFSPGNHPEFENWMIHQSERYERRFLAALAKLVDLRSAAGDFPRAIQYARQYLATDDLAEEIHRHLIELYIKSGDRAAALRQYESCVATLERELGVAPLPETRAAYETALADTIAAGPVTLETPAAGASWTVLPSLELPLIGRDEAWRQLEQGLDKLRSGGFIFISGEPGVGKSRLLQEFATINRERLVLTGNGYEGARDLPYQPIVQALRPALAFPGLWADIWPIWLAEVAAILPELHDHFDTLPARLVVEPDQAQARLFEALSQVVTGLANRHSLLLCLDDLHWADEATLAWLTYLTGRLSKSHICLLATYRSQEAQSLAGLRQNLGRGGLQAEVMLSGLSVQAIVDILRRLPTNSNEAPLASPQRLAARIHQATAGNAFFVLETIRNLLEGEQLACPAATLPLAPTVQEAVRRRLERLDPLSRQILDAAAVVYPDIGPDLLAPVAGRSEGEIVEGIEMLTGRQLLTGSGDELQFQHELARVVVYESLSVWRRRLLHRRTAEALVERFRGQTDLVAAQIAFHYEAAAELDLAKSYYRDAARVAQSQYAHREANRYLQRIIDLAIERQEDPWWTGRLYESLADNYRAMADFAAAEDAYRQALEEGPVEPTVWRAHILRKIAAVVKPALRFQEAEKLYDQAFMVLGRAPADPDLDKRHHWLQLKFDLLDLYYSQTRIDRMAAVVAETEPVVRELDAPDIWNQYYSAIVHVRLQQEQFALSAETIRAAQESYEYARLTGDLHDITQRQFELGFVLLWAGELDGALSALESALARSEKVGHSYVHIQCLTYLSILHRLRGEVSQVRHYLHQLTSHAETPRHRYYIAAESANKAWLLYRDSDRKSAATEAEKALSLLADTAYPFRWLANWINLAYGLEVNDLRAAFEAAADMLAPEQQRLPEDVTAALQAAVDTGESGTDQTLRDALARALALAQGYGYL